MNTTNNIFIPVPPFDIYDFINTKASKFCQSSNFRDPWGNPQKAISSTKEQLWDLFSDDHKIQFLGYLVNHTIESFQKHEKICHNPKGCKAEERATEVLYSLYGELKNVGLNVDMSFSFDDIQKNNSILYDIDQQLIHISTTDARVTADPQILLTIEELRKELSSLKNLYVLGKKKWHQQLTGIIGEYATNKGLDFVLAVLSPQLIALYHIIKFLIDKI